MKTPRSPKQRPWYRCMYCNAKLKGQPFFFYPAFEFGELEIPNAIIPNITAHGICRTCTAVMLSKLLEAAMLTWTKKEQPTP